MKLLGKFDAWVLQGPFTSRDLGLYRIIYSSCALLIAPDITWLANFPRFMFHPPPGPFELLNGIPSLGFLIGLEVLRTATLILVGLGVWTRYTSIAAAAVLLFTSGLTACLGKIDHNILVVIAPLILAFANWGDALSIDALRDKKQRPQPQWPLRLLALAIGLPFFGAALVKLATGWLSWSSQAAQGQFFALFLTAHRTFWLAPIAARVHVPVVWELADWATVIIEFGLLATVLWWRAFRIALAFAALFHLGVFLVMNIPFVDNVVVYGAFVSWGAVIPSRRVWLAAPVVAAAVKYLIPTGVTNVAILFGGAAIGVGYLAAQAWSARSAANATAS